MDPRFAFAWQAETLIINLAAEAEKLDKIGTGHPHGPFARSLALEMEVVSQDLQNLMNDANSGGSVPQYRFSALRRKTARLLGEALAVHQIGFLRSTKLDGGMCAIADRLLQQLSRAVGLELPQLTTVAESEFLGVASRVVRLRYPSNSIWDLPVLGHEFGHLFGPLWRQPGMNRYPQKVFLDKGQLGNRAVSEEYFCDLMATFLLGPAYVYTCLVTRFDPTDTDDGDTHPSDAARAQWLLKSLELLANTVADGDVRYEFQDMEQKRGISGIGT